jgi:hypothetical protein
MFVFFWGGLLIKGSPRGIAQGVIFMDLGIEGGWIGSLGHDLKTAPVRIV